MKRIFILLLAVLVSATAFAGTKYFKGDKSAPGTLSMETTADLTYYVRTVGNDSNGCMAYTDACLTIQEVVDRLPRRVRHFVTINIDAGAFDGVYLGGFHINAGSGTVAGITFEGVASTQFSPATGTGSGTTDGGGVGYYDDSSQTWTVDDLIGKFVKIGAATYRPIVSNTATRIEVAEPGTLSGGTAYSIHEFTTVINNVSADPLASGYALVDIKNVYSSRSPFYGITFYQVQLNGAAQTYDAIYLDGGAPSFQLKNSQIVDVYTPFYFGATGLLSFQTVVIAGCVQSYTETGYKPYFVINGVGIAGGDEASIDIVGGVKVQIQNLRISKPNIAWAASALTCSMCTNVLFDDVRIDSCGEWAVVLEGSSAVVVRDAIIDGCTQSGIHVGEVDSDFDKEVVSDVHLESATISNCGGNGVLIEKGSTVFAGALAGTGNTGWGVRVDSGGKLFLNDKPTITGSAGELTINDGNTAIDWDNFGATGDSAFNVDSGARAVRITF